MFSYAQRPSAYGERWSSRRDERPGYTRRQRESHEKKKVYRQPLAEVSQSLCDILEPKLLGIGRNILGRETGIELMMEGHDLVAEYIVPTLRANKLAGSRIGASRSVGRPKPSYEVMLEKGLGRIRDAYSRKLEAERILGIRYRIKVGSKS